MSLHVNGKEFLGLNTLGKECVAIPLRKQKDITFGDYEKAFHSQGYGFPDGVIKGPYSDLSRNSSEYTTTHCSDYTQLTDQPQGDGNYYLASDMTLTPQIYMEENEEFSGILDGCGHTLTINMYKDDYNCNSDHVFGALIGTLSGTLKNIKIVTNFYWRNTYGGSSANLYVGGVIGRILNGRVENVYVEVNHYSGQDYNMDMNGRPTDNAMKMVGGLVGSVITQGTIINTTVDIKAFGWRNTAGGTPGFRPNVKAGMGGFVAYVAPDTTCLIKNCTIKGYVSFDSYAAQGDSNTYIHKGGFVAYSVGNLSIINSKNIWSGGMTHDGGATQYYECSMVGAGTSSDLLTIENVLYSTNSYAKSNGFLEWQDTRTALFGQEYDDSLDDSITFVDDYVVFGSIYSVKVRSCGITPSTMKGTYIDSIVFENLTIDVSDLSLYYRSSTPGMFKRDITYVQGQNGKLTSIKLGYYGYLTNEAGTEVNTLKVYYNNGQSVDYTKNQSLSDVNIYNLYEKITINNVPLYITKNVNSGYYS